MTQVIIKSNTAANVKRLLQAAIEQELRVLKIGIEKTNQNLKWLEKQFGMESPQFYEAFQAGKMGDQIDYIKWAGEYETLQQLEQDYAELSEIQFC